MAGLVNINENNTLFCGGTIISNQYVLTAAACVREAEINKYQVGVIVDAFDRTPGNNLLVDLFQLDEFSLAVSESDLPLSLYTTDQLIAHENYSADPHLNDIGLVYIKKRIIFDSHVGQACLPFHESPDWNHFDDRKVVGVGKSLKCTFVKCHDNQQNMSNI